MATASHVERANAYARDVVAGTIPACKWIRLAAKRHLDDLERQADPDFPYRFDEAAAEKPCRFVELLPHTKGKWARQGLKLRLEAWQSFKTVCLFGWRRKSDGLRRFRKVFLLIPRKNAKSTWAAGIALYMFCADGEYGSEVYSGATSEKQAWEVFRPAKLMAQKTKALLGRFGISVNAKNLHILGNGSRFEPMIGTPGDGASPSCSIHDEYHEHETDVQVDTMETGMGAREQPILIIITTAGDNLAGPCYALQLEAQKVLEGVLPDPELFALIYTIDPEDDWTSDLALRKANPNYDVSVSGEYLQTRQRAARNNARKAGVFKTKHLNVWVQAREAYFNVQRWIESEEEGLRLADFQGQPARISIDLASKVDIAAMEITFELAGCTCPAAATLRERGFRYARFGRYFLPQARIDEGENEHYRGWVADGWLTPTEGDMIDLPEIQDILLAFAGQMAIEEVETASGWLHEDRAVAAQVGAVPLQVVEVPYDPHQATQLVTGLQDKACPASRCARSS